MKKHLLLALLLFTFGARGFAQVPLTVADGTVTNRFVPVYGWYADAYLKCQVVYPAADLAGMTGGTITALTFYLSTTASDSWGSADFHVRLADQFAESTISAYSTATMTEVYSGSLDGTQPTMTVTFTTPFTYTGGNLLLEVTNETKGTYIDSYFYGITATGASVQGYSYTNLSSVTIAQRNFIPKTTFTYTPGSGGPMCFDPMGLTVSGETTDGATVSWTAPAAGDSPQGYEVCCQPADATFDAATANWTSVTGTTHTFTGLSAGTEYTAHVRSVCGTGFYSNGNTSANITTLLCNPADQCEYTFVLGDGYGDGWNGASFIIKQNGITMATLAANNHNVYNTQTYDTMRVMLCGNASISLEWTAGQYNSEISFIMFDPNGTQLYECTSAGTLTDGDVFYTGTASCAPITCFPPTGLHASVTSDEATIGWTEVSGNHLGYQAEWDGSVLPGLSGNPFFFSGLPPASSHTVRVRTVCAAGDTSAWSAPLTFTMECASISTYPYIEGFENSLSIPACWESIDGDGDGNNWFIIQDSDGEVIEGGESTSGNHYITSLSYDYNTYAALTPNNWLLSPSFTLPNPCNLSLVWYAKSQDPSYLEPLDILMSTTGGDTAAFTTTVMSLNAVPGEYTQYVYSLANYAGQTVRFAFVHRNVTDQFRVNIDDVGILEIPQVVTNDATALATATATLNGSVTGQGMTAYGFEWKASADSDYERDTVATGNHTGSISFNLANLDPVTSYTFRTFAAVEGIIFYGDEKTFTTDQVPCPSPANLTVSNVDHESATLTWTSQLPTVGSYNVYLDNTLLTQTPVSVLTYTLTGLNPGTSYEVRVVTVCEGTEGLFDSKTFTTPCIREGYFAIGDTNNTSSYYWLPVNTYYNYSYTQQLFLASEMGRANLITNIAFNYAYTVSFTMENVKIYMGHTTKNVFASTTDTVPFSALTEVYSGNLSFSPGWNTFELDQPFAYNGNDNLVLALYENIYGYPESACVFLCAPAGGDRALDYYSDSQVPNPANLSSYTGGKGIRSFRNVVKFGYCDNSTCVPPTVSVDNVTAHDAEVSWTPGYQESAWGMQYKGENDNDWTTVTLTPNSANPYTLTNLAANTNYTVQMWSLCGNNEVSEITEKTFTTLVSCPAPTSPVISSVTANSVSFSWTPGGNESEWEVYYSWQSTTNPGIEEGSLTYTVNEPSYSFTGLNPNTAYTILVRAVCGWNDVSEYADVQFTTPCGTETMPWSENFDNWTSKSPCWSFLSGAFSGTPTVSSSAWGLNSSYGNYITISGKALTMNVFSTNNYWAVTPPINITSNTAMLNVDVAVAAWSSATTNYDANDTLAFAITTDNGTTYTTLQVFNNTELNALGNAYTTLSVPVSGYNGQTVRFAIFAGSAATGGDNRIVIDNVSVDEAPTCPAPAGVTVPNVTATTATLMWTPGGNENAWDIYVPSSSADVPVVNSDNMHSVTATSYTVSNLPSNSICTLYVRANCGNEESDWVSKTFTTPCGTVNIPYTEDFDSYSSSEYPTCWSRYPNTYSSSTNYPIINPNSAHSGSNSLYMYSYTSSYYMAILPELNLDGMSMSDLWVTFYYSFNGSSNSSNGKMIVGVMTNPADPTSFYPVDTVQHTAPTTWEFKKVHLTNYTGNGRYIAFRNLTTAAYAGFFIDDVTVEPIPSCLAPGNLSVSEVTATSTTLTWTPGNTETSWDVSYVQADPSSIEGSPTVNPTSWTNTSTPSYTFTGLTAGTTYTAFVRSNCGNDGVSDWVSKNFTAGTYNMLVSGWDTLRTCDMVIYDDGGANGDYSQHCNSYLVIYPDAPGKLARVSGTIQAESGWDYLIIYDGVSDETDDELLNTEQEDVDLPFTISSITSTTGPLTIYFYSDGSNQNPGFELTVSCVDAPTCLVTSTPVASDVTATGATLTWTPGGNETDWDLYVADITVDPTDAPSANSNPTAMVQNNPTYTLTGLTTSHIYKAYVRADCGNDGVSEWSNPVTFVPGSYNMGSVRTLTTCSATIYDDGGVDGNYGLNRNDTLTIYPATQGNLVQVSGTLVAESASYDYLIIYDGENVDSQHQLLKTTQTGSPTPFTIPVTTSTTGPLTLYFHADNLYSYAGFELHVTCVPPCEAPATVQASAVSHGQSVLTFGYDQQAQNINLELQYKATNATSWSSSISVQDNTYTLAGLDNNTTYDVRVRSACGNADAQYYSDWVTGMIDIACPAPVIPDATYYVYDDTTVMFYWDYSGMPTFNVMRVEGNTTTIIDMAYEDDPETYFADDLTPNTEYTFYVRSICNNGLDTSAWSNPITFITPETCPTPAALTAEDVEATEILFSVNGSGNVQGYQVEYGATGFAHGQGSFVYEAAAATASQTLIVIDYLTANTTYDFYVRAICGGNDTSAWSPVTTEKTLCNVISNFPWTETFNNLTAGIPDCWDNTEGTTTNAYHRWNYHATGQDGACLRYNSYNATIGQTNMLKTPVLNLGNLTNPQLTFSYKNPAGGDFSVYLSTDGGATYTTPIATGLTGISSWTGAVYILDALLANVSDKSRVVIVFQATSNYGNGDAFIYLDNVTVEEAPTCPVPMALTVEDVTNTEMMFSVNGSGNVLGYQVEYGATGFAHGHGSFVYEAAAATTSQTLIVIDNLTANTTYDFYVRTICSEGDTSAWSPVTTEKTLCDVVSSFPWSENFDAVSVNTLPDCWTNTNDVGSTSWKVTNSINGSISAHSGSNVMRFYYSGNESDQSSLQMPTFNLTSLNSPMIGFWYTNKEWEGDQDEMTVYYRTSPTDTWTLLASYTDNVAAWTYDSLALPNPSATYQIKFVGLTNYGFGINLDDIVIKEMPVTVCLAPTDVTVSDITASTAEVNWTNNANLTYELQYRTAGTAPQTVDTNITAAAIANANGLNDGNNIGSGTIDANISYTGILNGGSNAPKYYTSGQNIRLYSNTSGNGNGGSIKLTPSNGAVITGLDITTSGSSYTPSVSYSVDGGTSATATLSGLVYTISGISAATSLEFQNTNTNSSNTQLRITQMTIHYTLPGTDDAWTTIVPATSPTVLSNLDPETGYEVQVRTICSVGDTSDWSSVVPFSTEEFICGAPVKLSVNDITMNSAEVIWSDDGTYPTELQYMANGTPDQYVDNTFDFSQQGYANAQTFDGVTVNIDNNITFVAHKNSGSNAPAYYVNDNTFRVYAQNSFSVTAVNGAVITGIEIDANSNHPNLNWSADGGQSSSINGTSSHYDIPITAANTVTVTNPASTGNQLRMETLTVHYTIPGTAGTWTSMANVTSPVQLTGLMPNTNYSVRLRNICSASDTSVWTSTDFTTLTCPPITKSITAEACGSYTWDGTPYTTSGDYTKTYTLATGCDSVVTLHLTIHNPTHVAYTDSACGSYTWNNTEYTQSGTYTYPHQDANNCTQVDTLHLTVFHPTHVAYTESACGSYTWNNTEYTQSGTYTYPHQDANNCTQVDTLHLTIHNPTHVAYTESACGSYTWNNTEYTQSGTYTYSHQDANGCTQVDTLHLTINPIPVVTVTGDAAIALYESATLTASGASTYVWNTGETAQTITVTPASIGNHSYIVVGTSEFNCQSAPDTFVVEVGACRPGVSTETVTACDSYTWHGVTYTQSTNNATYRIANGAASGCDSVITLHLTILNKVLNEFSASNCVSYEWNGQVYTASGDYTQTFPAANGCDSIVTLHLTIKQPVTYAFATTVCGSYTWVDQTYNTSGIYTRTFQAANGCDSIVTLNLTVKQPVSTSISATACGSYTWNNEVYTTNGEYVQTFQAANGCDSVVILTLTINPVYDLNVDMPICKAALPYAWRDTLFGVGTQSGTYVFHRQTAAGCDSTVTLHLVVNDAIATEVTDTGCISYTWNNQVYTTSGNYVQVLQTAAGCDSTVTLHLTINNPVHQAFTEVACGTYTWNNTVYTVSGDYTYAHLDANGCTQVDTLHLTIKPVPVVTITSDPALPIIEYGESATLTASGADSYVWNTQQTSSTITVAPRVTNSYFVVGTTDGCVSDTVNITVTVGACQLILNEFSATGCHSYNWNGTVYTTSGDYQQHLYNDLGCDSVVTLHLTIYPNQGVARTVDACGSYTWYQQHFTQSGTYTFAYYDGNGCIQEDTLYLTIHNPVHESLNIVSCGPYMWNNTEYTQDGTYTYTHEDAHGCTQVDTLHLTIKPVPVVTVSSNNTQIVQHQSTTLTVSGATSYVWSNQATGATVTVTPMQTTTYSVVGTVDGCASEPDSITVYVTPCTPAEGVFTVTACDRYVWYGTTYTESTNTATHTIQRPGICDSIVTLHLTILHPVAEIINITACERYTWHNTTFTQSGRYTYSHQDANGCTQVDTLYLTILRPTHTAVTVSECNGFVWHNIEYTQSGTYTFAHEDVHGCTQVDTLYLTIFHPAHTAYNVDACGSYVWNNTEYTQSGTYTYRHRDANGCQQIDTLHLTIHHPVAQSYEVVACESYTWHNTVYAQSGTYTYAHEDAHGCMQVDTLRLTIHNAVAESFEAEACESYTWHNTVYTQSGTYTFAHADVNGCTQVDTLHLTIYNAVAEVYEAEACESYVWNNTEYTQSGTYTYAHEDIHGCTQVDTLHLIINNPTHTAVTESACGSYTWNNTEYTQSGTYTFAHADANGCTQVDTLHLTIFQPAVTEFSDNACGSYYWNNVYYNESGDYVQHFQTVDGCDSTVTLHLTIYPRAEVAGVVGDTLIHEYESATLTATALNGNPFWVGFGQTASITVAPMTTTTYTVMAVSEHCASAPVRVKVTVLPCIPVQGVETITACESYEWHGVTYTESTNTPTFTIERQGVCDSVVTLHLTIFNPTHVAYTESACGSYVWNNTEYTQSGTYTYTHTDAHGCTQVDTLHLTINNPVVATYEAEACGSYTWNNTVYTQSGTYTFAHLDAHGCTQVDTLHLTINNAVAEVFEAEACGSYTWNNTEYTQSGTYTFAHADVNGCTQVDTLHLTIHNPTHVAYTESACGSYVWNNTEYTQSGVYTYAHTDANGCTQVDTLHLTILNAVHEAFTVSECNAYTWHGTTYTQSGTYTYIHSDANGCTKVDTLHLTIFHPQPNVYTLTACGDYVWHGTVYTQTGVYTYTTTDINGCTQVDTLYLTVNRPQNTSSVAEACGSYMWRGNTYTQSGVYVKAVQNNFGCMYLDTLYLTIHQPLTQIVEATACESYTWNNVTYTQSGHYVQNFQTMFGCDSTVTLNLTVNHPQHQSVTVGECGPYTWHGTTYSQSGVYTYAHSDANGCTQVDTLHLIIYQPRHQSLLITECESFTWGGTTYTQSGVYTYAHPDNHGCTQVDTLYLTINHPTGTSLTVTECGMYDWNGFIYTQSGTYTQSHLDANGCTQVDTLRLTIYHPVHQSVTVTECFEYTWHGTTYTQSGIYTYVHTDNHGCTQVDTLHLTIHHPQSSTITVDACGSYQWYGTNYTQSGVYTHNVTGIYGCQVKDTLILHIHQPVSTQFSARACSYYVWDGTVYTQSGDYVKHYYTQWGCDSTVTLHLDIHQPQSTEFTIVTENSCYTWNGVEYCQNGTYMQQFEDSYGCDSVVTLHLTLRVGVEDYDGYAVSLYPNPTTGVTYVEVSGDEMERLEVYDSYGKLLQTRNVSGNVAQIELSAYAKGVYHVRVTTTKGVVTKRVVKN